MNDREKKEYVAPQMTVEEFDCHMLLCGSPEVSDICGEVDIEDGEDYEGE